MLKSGFQTLVICFLFALGTTAYAEEAAKKPAQKRIPTYPQIQFETTEGNFVVELDGRRFQVSPGDGSDLAKDLYAEHGFLANKLLAFRFVQDPTQPMPCQW